MKKASLAILLILFCLALYAGAAVFKRPLLQIAFLDVGRGNAVLVTSPSGNKMLIDGGPDKSVLTALGRVLPFYSRFLDVVLATSEKSSDIGGLSSVFGRFDVGVFVDSGLSPSAATYRYLLDEVSKENIVRILAKIGENVDLGDGVRFFVLSSGAEITGRIVYGNTSISIPSDIPAFEASSTDDIIFQSDGKNIWRK